MSLKKINRKPVYRAGDQNLIKEFYEPALKRAVSYDRAVGFFSTEALLSNLQGISSLVNNNGNFRLIIGHPLKKEEYRALKHGINTYRFMQDLDNKLGEIIEEAKETGSGTLSLFAYLVATKRIKIKYAFRRAGMYHEKIGITKENNVYRLVVQGSANETVFALTDGYNAESITVYRSWGQEFESYGKAFLTGFENLWNNKQRNTHVIEMPSEQYEKIIALTDAYNIDPESILIDDSDYKLFFDDSPNIEPQLPGFINNKKFELMPHQRNAIRNWWETDRQCVGILEHATGSGKTITAISAATFLFGELKKQNRKLALIISVPYIELAEQWVENLSLFNIYPIECWGNSDSWTQNLREVINRFNLGAINFFAIVAVNRTLTGNRFQEIIKNINKNELMVIGDECHHFGGAKLSKKAPKARFRLGLSATPFNDEDDDYESPFPDIAKDRIIKYFDKIVSSYTLEDAILDGVLTNYNYYVIGVKLTKEEQIEYDNLSKEIGKLIAIEHSTGLTEGQYSRLSVLSNKRSMLLGNIENKYVVLSDLVKTIKKSERPLSLFYCGAGHGHSANANEDENIELVRVIDRVSGILNQNGWVTSQFTSKEPANQRVQRMKDFVQGYIDALVTIRVLDEGVDVPACKTAFLLASTKNRRQYVQRRGRVLRKFEGKDVANIYDFITLPNDEVNS